MSISGDRWVWQDKGACHDQTDLFFGPEEETPTQMQERQESAVQLCQGCMVRTDCLEYALGRPERYGVWGGVTEEARKVLRRQRRRALLEGDSTKSKKISTVGDARILRGLARRGYGIRIIQEWTGLPPATLYAVRAGHRRAWGRSSSKKLRSVLMRILSLPPVEAHLVRGHAQAQEWVDLESWDWESIDDPTAKPQTPAA